MGVAKGLSSDLTELVVIEKIEVQDSMYFRNKPRLFKWTLHF